MSKKNGAARAVEVASRTKQIGVKLPRELVEEARSAAAELAGLPHQMTFTSLISDALVAHLEKLRRAHNSGRPFGPAPPRLKQGRPLKIIRK